MAVGDFHIAQANIARARAPMTDPVMRGFVEQLDYVNAVADAAPGFVWRLQTEDGDATAIRAFADPLIIVNMSVWESIDDLYRYVFESDHRGPLRDRRAWFTKLDRPHSVLWWIPAGSVPDLKELEHRLDLLAERGPSPQAFTFTSLYDPTGQPMSRPPRLEQGCGV